MPSRFKYQKNLRITSYQCANTCTHTHANSKEKHNNTSWLSHDCDNSIKLKIKCANLFISTFKQDIINLVLG